MWVRNTAANHGNVFVNCTFKTLDGRQTEIARAPDNKGHSYPNSEAVLIDCALEGISPVGWGAVGSDTADIHYWEFNSTHLRDGTPVDVSKRHPVSRQLRMPGDADIIANYSDPRYVLGGWQPEMAPLILRQPDDRVAKSGTTVSLAVRIAGIPAPTCQWHKDGKPLSGATGHSLTLNGISTADAGSYKAVIRNSSGIATSQPAVLAVQ